MVSSLPVNLFETYHLYKKGTREVIQWLNENCGTQHSQHHVDSVRKLEALSRIAVQKHITVPVSILNTLQKTIKARMKVCEYFQKVLPIDGNDQNASHAYFINVLERIHYQLNTLVDRNRSSIDGSILDTDIAPSSNIFSSLRCYETNEDGVEAVTYRLKAMDFHEETGLIGSELPDDNDILDQTMAIAIYLSQLDKLYTTVQSSWNASAVGSVPVIVATVTTMISYQVSKDLEAKLNKYGIYNPEVLYAKYEQLAEGVNNRLKENNQKVAEAPGQAIFAFPESLRECWLALLALKQTWNAEPSPNPGVGSPASSDATFDNITHFSQSFCCNKDAKVERKHLDILLRRMGHEIRVKSTFNAEMEIKTPLLEELKDFLEFDEQLQATTESETSSGLSNNSLCFGLLLFLESFRSHQVPPENAPTIRKSAKLSTLKLAIDMKDSTQNLIEDLNAPCGCLEIGGKKVLPLLMVFQSILGHFTGELKFDLYNQAPWVSGTYLLRHVLMASDYGLKTWHHCYFVGTTLHIYNALIVLGALKPGRIPVMEKLCGIFAVNVFLGSQPKRNLLSCYQRWTGAKIKFPAKKCQSVHNHRRSLSGTGKKWELEKVPDISQGGDDIRRSFDPVKISLLSLISLSDSVTQDDVVVRIYRPGKIEKASAGNIRKAQKQLESEEHVADYVARIQDLLVQEFRDDLPIAKMNYFNLYVTCCEIIRRISRDQHKSLAFGTLCDCIFERLIHAVDLHLEDPAHPKTAKDKALVNDCVAAFQGVLEGKDLLDFTWQL